MTKFPVLLNILMQQCERSMVSHRHIFWFYLILLIYLSICYFVYSVLFSMKSVLAMMIVFVFLVCINIGDRINEIDHSKTEIIAKILFGHVKVTLGFLQLSSYFQLYVSFIWFCNVRDKDMFTNVANLEKLIKALEKFKTLLFMTSICNLFQQKYKIVNKCGASVDLKYKYSTEVVSFRQ